jgi:hypothetical protein
MSFTDTDALMRAIAGSTKSDAGSLEASMRDLFEAVVRAQATDKEIRSAKILKLYEILLNVFRDHSNEKWTRRCVKCRLLPPFVLNRCSTCLLSTFKERIDTLESERRRIIQEIALARKAVLPAQEALRQAEFQEIHAAQIELFLDFVNEAARRRLERAWAGRVSLVRVRSTHKFVEVERFDKTLSPKDLRLVARIRNVLFAKLPEYKRILVNDGEGVVVEVVHDFPTLGTYLATARLDD